MAAMSERDGKEGEEGKQELKENYDKSKQKRVAEKIKEKKA